jgi:hypothetical protein
MSLVSPSPPLPPAPLARPNWCHRSPHAAALLALAALVLLLFAPELLNARRVLGAPGSDMQMQFFAWRQFGFGELAQGRFPLWNPWIYAGAPFFGGVQSALLYPLNFLFLILPTALACNWSYALHAWLLGAFMFAWARLRGLRPCGAFYAGAILMFSGVHMPQIFGGHPSYVCTMAWAPAILCCVEGWLRQRRCLWLLAGAGAVAIQIFAGHPQYVFYTALGIGFYALLRLMQSGRKPATALGLLAIYPAGALLAAVQLLTALQATQESVRGARLPWDFVASFSFPPENFLTLFAPNVFGTLAEYWGRCHLWEMSLFIGVTGSVLTALGIAHAPRRTTWPLLASLAILLLLALGSHTPLLAFLYQHVWGFDKFRGASKFIFPAALFLAPLVGMGLDAVLHASTPAQRRATATGAFAAVLLLAGGLLLTLPPTTWSNLLQTLFATGECTYSADLLRDLDFQTGARLCAAFALLQAGGVAALLAVLFAVQPRRPTASWGVLALGLAELCLFARGTLVTIDSSAITPAALKQFLAQHPGDERILGIGNNNSAMLLGRGDLWGSDPNIARRYAEFITWTQGGDPDAATQVVYFKHWNNPLLSLVRLRYVILPDPTTLRVLEAPTPPPPRFSRRPQVSGRPPLA